MKQSDSSSSSSSDEDSSSNEEIETKKELPSRSTRGLRMNKLLGEAKEADQDFWEQDAWNIDDNDAQYSSEEEEEDIFDHDFDEDENPDDEVHDEDRIENTRLRKKTKTTSLAYREPYCTRVARPSTKRTTDNRPSQRPNLLIAGQRQLRKSTVEASTVFSQALAKRTIEMKKSQGRKKGPLVTTPLTQQALIAEAVRTEILNKKSLHRLQKLADEQKKRQSTDVHAPPRDAGTIRYHSKLGQLKTITFQLPEDTTQNNTRHNIQSAIFYNSGKANHHRHHHRHHPRTP